MESYENKLLKSEFKIRIAKSPYKFLQHSWCKTILLVMLWDKIYSMILREVLC